MFCKSDTYCAIPTGTAQDFAVYLGGPENDDNDQWAIIDGSDLQETMFMFSPCSNFDELTLPVSKADLETLKSREATTEEAAKYMALVSTGVRPTLAVIFNDDPMDLLRCSIESPRMYGYRI